MYFDEFFSENLCLTTTLNNFIHLSHFSSNAERRKIFIDEIEKLTLRLSNDLMCGRQLQIPVAYRLMWDNCEFNNQRLVQWCFVKTKISEELEYLSRLYLKPLGNGQIRKIVSARKIGVIMYVLSFIYKLLISNATCTKR